MQNISTLAQTRKFLEMNYESLVFDIDLLKQNGDIGFFDRMRLKNMLKKSEDISVQFVKIDNMLNAHREANAGKIEDLVRWMEQEIKDSIKACSNLRIQNTEHYRIAVLKVGKMLAEKNKYPVFRMKKFVMPVTEVRVKRDDEAEILSQKSDYLMDQVSRLNDYAADLDRVIASLAAENSLKRQCLKLIAPIIDDSDIRSRFMSLFPDSILSFQRLPLSRALVSPTDGYETLVERLTLEKEAALSRMKLYSDDSADIREMAEYKTKMWNK